VKNGPPKTQSNVNGLLLCIPKLNNQININHCKRQAHEKSLNNLPIFFLSRRQNTLEINKSTKLWYGQTMAKKKNTSHLVNNTNEVQIIEIPTNPPK
jgi:hypothetical protein